MDACCSRNGAVASYSGQISTLPFSEESLPCSSSISLNLLPQQTNRRSSPNGIPPVLAAGQQSPSRSPPSSPIRPARSRAISSVLPAGALGIRPTGVPALTRRSSSPLPTALPWLLDSPPSASSAQLLSVSAVRRSPRCRSAARNPSPGLPRPPSNPPEQQPVPNPKSRRGNRMRSR